MKKLLSLVIVIALTISTTLGLVGCKSNNNRIRIALPNDATNEARALLLLEDLGIIEVDDNAGITATIRDITSNPYNIKFVETEAAQLPRTLKDVDFAVINSNYALSAGLNPVEDSIAIESSSSAYSNIIAVKSGNEDSNLTKALVAAVSSQQVADFITSQYGGAVVSVVGENATDGYDATIDYSSLAGQTITVAASPTPHAEILQIAKSILAERNITLRIIEYNDYIVPNNVVQSGEVYANYFQHLPYLDEFNASNNTNIVSVGAIHVEPMGLYTTGRTGSIVDIILKIVSNR